MGAARKYDPKPGELFCGQLVLGPSDWVKEPGTRWYSVACPRCDKPRDVNLYDLIAGKSRGCRRCFPRHAFRPHFQPDGGPPALAAPGVHLDSYLDDVLPVTAKPKGSA